MKIELDKLLHLLVGYIIAITITTVLTVNQSFIYGFLTSVLVGVGKELYDYYSKKGTPDKMDTLFTIIGGFLGILITFVKL